MAQYAEPWTGEQEFADIVEAIGARSGQRAPPVAEEPSLFDGLVGEAVASVADGAITLVAHAKALVSES